MGNQARMRRDQRARLRQQRAGFSETIEKRGEELQELAASLHDEECARLTERYRGDQLAALAQAGWRQAEQNRDGLGTWDHRGKRLRVIHSVSRHDGQVWAHVSVSSPLSNTLPGWYDVQFAGRLLYPRLKGIIVVAPVSQHVNIANVAHVWYCLTAPACPDFTEGTGSI